MCVEDGARPPLPPMSGAALDAREVELTSRDGTTITTFSARAEAPSGAGVVILPDVRGLHPYYRELSVRFAEAGVHAAAVDLYARSAGPGMRGEDFEYEPHVRQLRVESVDADVAATVAELRSARGGAPDRTYTLGFCLGGRISFLQAATGLGLSGVIGFYGWPVGPHRTGLPAPADGVARFACPVLAIYGGADEGIPAEPRDAFDRALDSAGVEHRTVVYEDAPHSFFDRRATDFADAGRSAWREVLAFMRVA